MRAIGPEPESANEVAILARVHGKDHGQLPVTMARYYLTLALSEVDQVRMHDLSKRNQDGLLSSAEQQELIAYAKAGSLLSLLKSRACRVLRVKPLKSATFSPGGVADCSPG